MKSSPISSTLWNLVLLCESYGAGLRSVKVRESPIRRRDERRLMFINRMPRYEILSEDALAVLDLPAADQRNFQFLPTHTKRFLEKPTGAPIGHPPSA